VGIADQHKAQKQGKDDSIKQQYKPPPTYLGKWMMVDVTVS